MLVELSVLLIGFTYEQNRNSGSGGARALDLNSLDPKVIRSHASSYVPFGDVGTAPALIERPSALQAGDAQAQKK